jgi:hypothetical protein
MVSTGTLNAPTAPTASAPINSATVAVGWTGSTLTTGQPGNRATGQPGNRATGPGVLRAPDPQQRRRQYCGLWHFWFIADAWH